MSLHIAIQMDPILEINVNTDSTFALILEAIKRNYIVYVYEPDSLTYKFNDIYAKGQKILSAKKNKNQHVTLSPDIEIKLSECDIVLMRQDPPFNMSYITATYLLDQLDTLVLNNPTEVRNCPEKLFVTRFPYLMPNTIITRNTSDIYSFLDQHKEIIIKPLYGNGGTGIFYFKEKSINFETLLEALLDGSKEPIIIQEFLPNVTLGDKRIILFDGKPVGAVNRVPKSGEIRSNIHVGGTAKKTTLNKQDMKICETIGPELKNRGLFFAGIDVINGKLTEINVTSPTCIQEIEKFNGTNISKIFWDNIIEKV